MTRRAGLVRMEAWTVDLYKDELATVIRELGLVRYHLFGSSWGGMLAMEHALTRPAGLASLVIASSPSSMPQWVAEANRLRLELPRENQDVLLKHEADGTTSDPEYAEAELLFYQRHVCRLDASPDCVVRAFAKLQPNCSHMAFVEEPDRYLNVLGGFLDRAE